MKVRAYNAKGKRVKCSECGSKETVGALMGTDSTYSFCADHSPYESFTAKLIYDPELSDKYKHLRENKDFVCKDSWTIDLREKK